MEYRKLKEYCTITSSKRIFAEQYVDFGVPFYRSKEIIEKNNKMAISEKLYISKELYNIIKNKYGVPKKGDLLLTSVGTLGIPYIVQEEEFYFKDGNLTWMKDFSPNLCSRYLYYWLNSGFGKQSLIQKAIGSSQGAITIDILKNYKLYIPSLSTQQKIADILSAYDELIEKNNRKIEILEQEAEELYKEWFVRFRFPGHKSTPFENGLPQGWKWGIIKDVGEFIRGKNITSEEMIEGNIPVISAGIEPAGYHNKANVFGVSATVSNSGANAGYLSLHYDDIWAADCSYVQSECIFYLYELLNSMRVFLDNLQKGAAQPHVYAKDINKIKIKLPNTELIIKANNILSKIHIKIKDLLKQNELLKEQRDLLLPRLMSGKLEVNTKENVVVNDKFNDVREYWQKVKYDENNFGIAARSNGKISEETLQKLKDIAEEDD